MSRFRYRVLVGGHAAWCNDQDICDSDQTSEIAGVELCDRKAGRFVARLNRLLRQTFNREGVEFGGFITSG